MIALQMSVSYHSGEEKTLQSLPMALQSRPATHSSPGHAPGGRDSVEVASGGRKKEAVVFGRAPLDGEGALPVCLDQAAPVQ